MFVSADKPGSSGSNLEIRRRKQVITPKFLSVPNGTGDHIRERSWTLPASPEAQSGNLTWSAAPGVTISLTSHFCKT